MKKFEGLIVKLTYVLLGVYFLATLFRVFSWSLGEVLTNLSIGLFCHLFLAYAVIIAFRTKPYNGLNISSSFIGALAGSIGSMAVLYNVMEWPDSYEITIMSIPVLFVFLFLRLLKIKVKGFEFEKIDKVILAVTLFIGISVFI